MKRDVVETLAQAIFADYQDGAGPWDLQPVAVKALYRRVAREALETLVDEAMLLGDPNAAPPRGILSASSKETDA